MEEYVICLESKVDKLQDRLTDKKSPTPSEISLFSHNPNNKYPQNEETSENLEDNSTTLNAVVYLNQSHC